MTTTSKEERRSWWTTQVRAQVESDLTVREFCAQGGLPVSSFMRWKKKLREESDRSSSEVVAVRAPSFIEVELPASVAPVVRVMLGSVTVDFETLPPPAWVAELAAYGGTRC